MNCSERSGTIIWLNLLECYARILIIVEILHWNWFECVFLCWNESTHFCCTLKCTCCWWEECIAFNKHSYVSKCTIEIQSLFNDSFDLGFWSIIFFCLFVCSCVCFVSFHFISIVRLNRSLFLFIFFSNYALWNEEEKKEHIYRILYTCITVHDIQSH